MTELVLCGLAAAPAVVTWMSVAAWTAGEPLARALAFALILVPSYVLFALLLLVLSPLATWLTGARTPADAALVIREMSWPLLRWARYMAANHVVRVLAGPLFRGSPIWTCYLRLNGARVGRGVYVNTLAIADHNLLAFGDHVIIGADVHISGHTVEAGVLKTGRVDLAREVGVGLGAAISLGVAAGPGCQVGAFTFVPKHASLEAHATYVGIPARKLPACGGSDTGISHGDWGLSTTAGRP